MWVNEEYIKKKLSLPMNIDWQEIKGHINIAEELNMREIMGKILFDDLTAKITSNTLSIKEDELVEMAKMAIAYRAVAIAVPFLSLKLKSKGVVRQSDEFVSGVSLDEIKYLEGKYSDLAGYYEKRVQDFLLYNKTDFDLWLKVSLDGEIKTPYANLNSPFDNPFYTEGNNELRIKNNRYFG